MALARWQATIVNAAGDVQPGASIEVRREVPGQPLASLFSDRNGASPISNAFTADAEGFAAFHAAGGAYKITATLGGFSRTWRYVAIGTASENDITGVAVVQAVAAGYALNFETGTTAPPSAGAIRFDNADLSLATEAYVSVVNAGGSNIKARLLELFDSGNEEKDQFILSKTDDNLQASFKVDGAADNTTYVTLDISEHAGETEFDAGLVSFQRERAGPPGFSESEAVGSVKDYFGTTAPLGWLFADGRTIGSGISGATSRANADTATLFALLWDSVSNTDLPIQDSSGSASTRGANAAADFAANKRLPLVDYRGRVSAGKDNMNGTSANRLTGLSGGLDGDVLGKTGGKETHALVAGENAAHIHGKGTIAAAAPTITLNSKATNVIRTQIGGPFGGIVGNGALEEADITASSSAPAITGDTASAGSGDAHNNVQPTIIANKIIRYAVGSIVAASLVVSAKNSIEIDADELQLVGDTASPGNNKVYGTDGSGVRGWKADPTSSTGVGKNAIINGSMRVAQRGTSFTSAGGANNDDVYVLDRWNLLSDGNDIVGVTQATDVPAGALFSMGLDVETVNKKFGVLQVIEQKNCADLIGQTVVLSAYLKVTNTTRLDKIKMAIVAWDGTADTVTSDIVSAWGADGTNPTLVSNWTYENTPADLGVTTSWARYSVSAAVDTASAKNIGLFIWSDNVTDTDLGDFLYIANVKLELGAAPTAFETPSIVEELDECLRYYMRLTASGTGTRVANGMAIATTDASILFPNLRLRTAPTVAGTAGLTIAYLGTNTAVTGTAINWSGSTLQVGCTTAAVLTAGHAVQMRLAATSDYFEIMCEM